MNNLLEMKISSADASGKASELMEHHEAIEMMASERYLLNELTPELRDAYEEHMFGCTECANDARFGAAFVDHAKTILPGMEDKKRAPVKQPAAAKPPKGNRDWLAWLRPGIMVPAFGCLLAIVGYQNLVVYPALETAATEPRVLPPATVLPGDVRSSLPVIYADLVTGSTLSIPLTQNSGQNAPYASYRFDFYDSKNKLIWTHSITGTAASDDTATIWLPGRVKEDSYKLTTTGITADGRSIPVHQQFFELRVKK